MSDKLKSLKNLESSFLMLSNKSSKNPMSTSYLSQEYMQSSGNLSSQAAKLLKMYGHSYNKSETNVMKAREQRNLKKKENDYVKKIIHQNQDMGKKLRELEEINESLREDKRGLVISNYEMKREYLLLKEKYIALVAEYGIESSIKFIAPSLRAEVREEERFGEVEAESEVELDILNKLFRGVSTESCIINSEVGKGREQEEEKGEMEKLAVERCLGGEEDPEIANLNRRNTVFSFRRSQSVATEDGSTQTHLPEQPSESPLIKNYEKKRSQQCRLSPSSRQTELLRKISTQETAIKQLERKNEEVMGKYEMIKSIIGAGLKTQ